MSQPDSIIQAISADLSSYETSNTALQTAISHPRFSGRAPDHVFLCAGFAKPGFFVQASERDLKQGLEGVYWVAVWTAQVRSSLSFSLGPVIPSRRGILLHILLSAMLIILCSWVYLS